MKKLNLQPTVSQAAEYIFNMDTGQLGNMTAAHLEEKFNTENTDLDNLFQDEMGLTLKDFLVSEKMYRAAKLLKPKKRNPPIPEKVALRLGYDNLIDFSNDFMNKFGTTPEEFCKTAGKR